MDSFIDRLKKCTRDDFKEHSLFSPSQMASDLAKLRKGVVVYKNKMDQLMSKKTSKDFVDPDENKMVSMKVKDNFGFTTYVRVKKVASSTEVD